MTEYLLVRADSDYTTGPDGKARPTGVILSVEDLDQARQLWARAWDRGEHVNIWGVKEGKYISGKSE